MYGQGQTRGKVGLLTIPATTNQACAAIIPNVEKVDRHFLFQNLASRYEEIRGLSNIGNQENLNSEILKSLSIHLPPLPEQRRIAAVLSAADLELKGLREELSLLRQQKNGLMHRLLTRGTGR